MFRLGSIYVACMALVTIAGTAFAQTESATITGRVTDSSNAIVQGAEIQIRSEERGTIRNATTNSSGLYFFPAVQPGRYDLAVQHPGFRRIDVLGLNVNVEDHVEENFKLQVGSAIESVTVNAESALVDTQDATVSTVIDRNFADNLPMNGRSFQTLIEMTPGVVPIPAGTLDSGQFSVNGQRGSSNYWMVDGVSANVGSSALFGGQQSAGAIGTTSVLGGTNSLVSVDALQEFRIQTSSFAPEYGRTPGAQISIVTRSGANKIHGSVFDYLRNDVFDATDWFDGFQNNPPLPKAEERQNDFGGTFSGPILKDHAFFFFSYEGLRLRLPTTVLSDVPDQSARMNASPAMQPYLEAYPFDAHQPDLGNGVAQFNATFSNPAALDAYSIRIDERPTDRVTIFGRYNYSPSSIRNRASAGDSMNSLSVSGITTQTLTIGSTVMLSSNVTNELRFNYSRTNASSHFVLDDFGGALPLPSSVFPSSFDIQNARLNVNIFSLTNGFLDDGAGVQNIQRQFNVVDNATFQKRTHEIKAGVDYRRLAPLYAPLEYHQLDFFSEVAAAESGSLFGHSVLSSTGATFLFRNLSLFAQDTWRILPRLTVTYGVRWDNDFAPSSLSGPAIPAASGFNLNNLSQLALAPTRTPSFKTTYGNVAPRVGAAYQISAKPKWGTVARAGYGLFYDLATSEAANLVLRGGYPFSAGMFTPGGTFPLSSQTAAPPPIEPPNADNQGTLAAFDPRLKLPYIHQWNFALEQQLGGEQQSLSATYVGSAGRRLLQTLDVFSPNPNLGQADIITNAATSDYDALQLQFQRRLSRSLQTVASYTFSHSIDTASSGSTANGSNVASSVTQPQINRASSDFDVRHAASAGLTYSIPSLQHNVLARAITQGWSLQTTLQTHSAPPFTVVNSIFSQLSNGLAPDIRPDLIPGFPLYLYGQQYPGGKAVNNTPGLVTGGCSDGSQSIGPFCPPPVDSNGNPIRQGNLPRNSLRGFPLFQWDLAAHRDFALTESVKLQFRAELFNALNHPNFAPPVTDISDPNFGISTQMLGQYLDGQGAGGAGSGGFNGLYQIGGPRSMQFALKLSF